MNKHTTSTIQTFLNKGIAAGEVLYDIFISHVVKLHDMMLVVHK